MPLERQGIKRRPSSRTASGYEIQTSFCVPTKIRHQTAYTHEQITYTAPIPSSLHQLTMHSPATTSSTTLSATVSVGTPATSQYESDNPPDCLPTKRVGLIPFNVNGPELKKSHLVRVHPRFLPRHILQSHLDVRSKRLFVRQRRDKRTPQNPIRATTPIALGISNLQTRRISRALRGETQNCGKTS